MVTRKTILSFTSYPIFIAKINHLWLRCYWTGNNSDEEDHGRSRDTQTVLCSSPGLTYVQTKQKLLWLESYHKPFISTFVPGHRPALIWTFHYFWYTSLTAIALLSVCSVNESTREFTSGSKVPAESVHVSEITSRWKPFFFITTIKIKYWGW